MINQEAAVDVASSHNGQDECATEHCRGTQIEETGGKGVTMLLSSVPIAMKQEAIFTRELTCAQLVYKSQAVPTRGLTEKASLFTSLTKVVPAKTPIEASEALRQWQR